MKRAVKTSIVSLAICLSLAVSGLAQPVKIDSDIGSAVFQRDRKPDKEPERPKERPKDDKRDDKRDDKDKRKKPEFF